MKRTIPLFSLSAAAILLTFGLVGCGSLGMSGSSNTTGSSSGSTSGNSTGPVETSFSISDTPPTGVTVLRFQIQVANASLQPMGGGTAVSMLSSSQVVELTHLQSEAALLANPSVPAATYTSLTATFANPQMTILNRSNTTYQIGSVSCAPGAVCTGTPTLNQATAVDSSAPFPITLSSASPVAFVLHFDVDASVTGSPALTVSPTISLKELPPLPGQVLTQFHVLGRITAVSSPGFTIQTGFGNVSINLTTTSSTQYNFGSVCGADDFACLLTGEVVRVGVNGMPGGTLDATDVDLIAQQGLPALEGTVIAVNTAQNQVELALGDFQDDSAGHLAAANFAFGLALTVNISKSTTFSIDTDGITLPTPALSFASINDFVVGQTVAILPGVASITFSVPPAAIQISFSANSISLESSELTATVASTNASGKPPSFTLNALSPLFTAATPAISEITVDTATGTNPTNFENGLSGVGGLSDGNTVSVGGLLFNTASAPTLVAERVLLQQ